MTARCRSCRAPILWAVNGETGRRIPLNPNPDPRGNILITSSPDPGGTDDLTCRPWTAADRRMRREFNPDREMPYDDLHVSHFATCPDAHRWRSTVKRTDPELDAWLSERGVTSR